MKNLAILGALFCISQAKVLPTEISELMCRKSDANFDICTWKSFEKLIPYLVKGVPELHLPPMDPLQVPHLKVNRTISDLVSITADFTNGKLWGTSKAVIEHLKADPNKLTLEMRVKLPATRLEVHYDVQGQLLQIPMFSKGVCTANYTESQSVVKANLQTFVKKGVKYFKLDKFSFKFTVGDGRILLTADNPALQFGADLISSFHNENTREVLDAVNPIFSEAFGNLFRTLVNRVLSKVPANEVLPDYSHYDVLL